ncbi:MAG: CHRD domain-containing protein, partial [Verrucomicrobiota bacterium]|nr:CHRD domain-containing protein [Verrucomicrobiota bacterium]
MGTSLQKRWLSCAFAGAVLCLGVLPTFAQDPAAVVNISTRMRVETGDNVLIGGFIVVGTGQKTVAVRALGPSLPVVGALADPILELHDASGATVATNDNWRATQQQQLIAAGLAPTDDLESALIATLNVGNYTVVVRGVNNTSGVGLVEVYDLDPAGAPSRLVNISTRGDVQAGDDVMIGGFILRGQQSKRVLMRVRGPTLSLNGALIPGRLADPTLELFNANGQSLISNDGWHGAQEQEIAASGLAPTDDREPAVIATLGPGGYTAVVRGQNGTTGIALVEMYDLDQPPQVDGSTLYLAQLRAQGSTISNGSGSAAMRLAADGLSAILSFSYTNLSSPVTSIHIHGPGGVILFDLDQAQPQPDGTYIWVFTPVGNLTVADIVAALRAGQLYLNLHTSNYPSGEINGYFNFSTGGQAAPTPTPPPALPGGTPTVTDASRFLEQATFG